MTEGSFTFGVFELDSRTMVLYRKGEIVPLPTNTCKLLYELARQPGKVISKKQLLEAVWPKEIVSDGSVHQGMSQVRAVLDPRNPRRYIRTFGRAGYRFLDPEAPSAMSSGDVDIDAELNELSRIGDGRVLLETLNRDQIAEARVMLEGLLPRHSQEPRLHLVLANACALQYESTRADETPDVTTLRVGLTYAIEAVRQASARGEAWAVLGFILDRVGRQRWALAALRKGVRLAIKNWMPHARLAYVTWGQERLDEAYAAIALLPSPMAHLLAATVFIGRGLLAQAEAEIDAALALMTDQPPDRFHVVAVCWLKGLLCLARGDDNAALVWLHRELALEARGQLYARECCANVHYAIGVIHRRRGDTAAARAAFREAIARVPRHPMAHVGRLLLVPRSKRPPLPVPPTSSVDAAMAQAALHVDDDDVAGAAKIVGRALDAAPKRTSEGWLIPIDPLLNVQAAPDLWTAVLATLKARGA